MPSVKCVLFFGFECGCRCLDEADLEGKGMLLAFGLGLDPRALGRLRVPPSLPARLDESIVVSAVRRPVGGGGVPFEHGDEALVGRFLVGDAKGALGEPLVLEVAAQKAGLEAPADEVGGGHRGRRDGVPADADGWFAAERTRTGSVGGAEPLAEALVAKGVAAGKHAPLLPGGGGGALVSCRGGGGGGCCCGGALFGALRVRDREGLLEADAAYAVGGRGGGLGGLAAEDAGEE